jgi:DNA-directed RNA polymerase
MKNIDKNITNNKINSEQGIESFRMNRDILSPIGNPGAGYPDIPFSSDGSWIVTKSLLSKLEKLTSNYNSSSPIYRELLITLIKGPLDITTQIKIETFLKTQALELTKEKIDAGKGFKFSNVNNNIILKVIQSKAELSQLINNYKTNLELQEENSPNLISLIMGSLDVDFAISIMLGRVLDIIAMSQLRGKKNKVLDITMGLGLEIINNFFVNSYKSEIDPDNKKSGFLKEKSPNIKITLSKWKIINKDLVEKTTDVQIRYKLGSILINWMCELNLVQNYLVTLGKTEKYNILIPGEGFQKLLPKSGVTPPIIAIPSRIPMIVKPKLYEPGDNVIPFTRGPLIDAEEKEPRCKGGEDLNYENLENRLYIDGYKKLGGYYLNDVESTDEIVLETWELKTKNMFSVNNDIFNMINFVNSVSFKINEEVLDFILVNNNKYNFFIDPNHIHPLTSLQKLTKKQALELESFYSKKFIEQNILGLASIFRVVPAFYLPVQLDYRGRLYCMVAYLNYQGTEMAKSLLLFSKGEKVDLANTTAINYLKIFGANCYGHKLNKKSFVDRIAWVNENSEDIINFTNGVLLNKAENKLLFFSFCFEFKKYIYALNEKSTYFISHLPVQYDASVNGFQHLTLLIDEIALASELNLSTSSPKDTPKDFYTFVSLRVKLKIEKELEGEKLSIEDRASYTKLSKFEIFRALVKRVIMVTPYNASPNSIIDYLKEFFDEVRNPDYKVKTEPEVKIANKKSKVKSKKKTKKTIAEQFYVYELKSDHSIVFTETDFRNLRKILNIVIFEDFPKLKELVGYLKTIADISNKLNLPIPWILPTGFVVQQQFHATETLKVKPFIYSKNLLNLTAIKKDEINKNKQKIALMPNLVHSLDAASLGFVIVNYFKQAGFKGKPCLGKKSEMSDSNLDIFANFFSIHDCFAVPCNKVSEIDNLLKSAYTMIYSKNKYLIEFDSNFIASIKKHYGEEAVSIDEEKKEMTVKTASDSLTMKYIPVTSIINSDISQIDVTNSSYIIH